MKSEKRSVKHSSRDPHVRVNLQKNRRSTKNINTTDSQVDSEDRSATSFTIISTMISVLIICFTTNKPNVLCHITIKQATANSIINNSRPFSVATGHLNNDSWLDIVVANSGTNNVGILIGYGNGSFADPIFYAMGYDSRPNSVVFGHFNNDGWIDIAVTSYAADNIKILLNCPAV